MTEVKEKIKELEKKFDKMEEKYNIKALTNTINMLIDNSPKLKELEQKLYDHDQNLTYNFRYSRENKERLEAVLKEHTKIFRGGLFISGDKEKELLKQLDGTATDNRHWAIKLTEGIMTKFLKGEGEPSELDLLVKNIRIGFGIEKEEQEGKTLMDAFREGQKEGELHLNDSAFVHNKGKGEGGEPSKDFKKVSHAPFDDMKKEQEDEKRIKAMDYMIEMDLGKGEAPREGVEGEPSKQLQEPSICKQCDYDYFEDCIEGCLKQKYYEEQEKEEQEAKPITSDIKEMMKKIREDLDKSLAKERKDHPRIESNLIADVLKDWKQFAKWIDNQKNEILLAEPIIEEIEKYEKEWVARKNDRKTTVSGTNNNKNGGDIIE